MVDICTLIGYDLCCCNWHTTPLNDTALWQFDSHTQSAEFGEAVGNFAIVNPQSAALPLRAKHIFT
jgi:hypothetical protein